MTDRSFSEAVELADMTAQQQGKKGIAHSLDMGSDQKTVPKISLVWHKVSLSLRIKDPANSTFFKPAYKRKKILHGVSGTAKSGELIAIMGPTGCGKSSLMNILASRVAGMKPADTELVGTVFMNNQPRVDSIFRKISAYVLQDDRLYPHLTVYETLMLAAHFYMADDVSNEEKGVLVENVMNELGLAKVKNTIIGNERVRGVSGGERRRATIAVQLIFNPLVLFLDEPTTGLDSFQSQAVMDAMKNMTLFGRLVIAVIHQPRSSIFNSFDKLLLLSEGHTIYMGKASEALEYFSQSKFSMHSFYNPADFFLDILSPDSRTKDLDDLAKSRIKMLADRWNEIAKQQDVLSTSLANDRASYVPINSLPNTNPVTVQRVLRNLKLLCWRSFSALARDRPVIISKCTSALFFACLIGAMYHNIAKNQAGMSNRQGLLFLISINQGFNNMVATVGAFPREKVISNRERAAGAYDAASYLIAKFFSELPINLFPAFLFGTIIYWIADLNRDRFGQFIAILLFEVATAIAIGLAISSYFPTVEAAAGFTAPTTIIFSLFGGYYINLNSLPIVANWIAYASFLRWAFQALVINEFTGETFSCADSQTNQCLQTGQQVIESLSFQHQSVNISVLGLTCCALFFLALAIFFLTSNSIRYMPMNYAGSRIRKIYEPTTFNSAQTGTLNMEAGR